MKKITNPWIYLSVLLIIFAFANISHSLTTQSTSVFTKATSQTKNTKQDTAKPSTQTDASEQSSEDQKDQKDQKDQEESESETTSNLQPGEELSIFEKFIVGKLPSLETIDIRQFGYDLFTEPASTFTPAASIPVGPGYIVGPDDEIKITVWGKIDK